MFYFNSDQNANPLVCFHFPDVVVGMAPLSSLPVYCTPYYWINYVCFLLMQRNSSTHFYGGSYRETKTRTIHTEQSHNTAGAYGRHSAKWLRAAADEGPTSDTPAVCNLGQQVVQESNVSCALSRAGLRCFFSEAGRFLF